MRDSDFSEKRVFCVVVLKTQTATFRHPEFQNFHKTLLLPPPTTLIGLAGAALGLSPRSAQTYFGESNFWLGVYGKSRGIMKDLWKYNTFDGQGSIILKEILFDNEFILIYGSESQFQMEALRDAFLNPVYALSLGNNDSLVKVKYVELVEQTHSARTVEHCLLEGDIVQEVLDNTASGLDFSIYSTSEPITFDLPSQFQYESDYGVRRVIARQQLSFVGEKMILNIEKEGILYQNKFIPIFPLKHILMLLDEILAKSNPNETLVQHTENMLEIWQQLFTRYQPVLKVSDDFWKKLYIATLFHDFGKVAENFQLVLKEEKKYDDNYIRHEFLSGMVLYSLDPTAYRADPASVLAVFSHHKPLFDNLFQEQDSRASIVIQQEKLETLSAWFNAQLANKGYGSLSSKLFAFLTERCKKDENGINFLYKNFDAFFTNFRSNPIAPAVRTQYILYKALLNIADWTASAHGQLPGALTFDKHFLEQKIIEKLRAEGKEKIASEFKFLDFQLNSMVNGSTLAVAPTGSGKTEAALLWASQKGPFEKIIYLLPTRVTSNAIYQRLVSYFGKKQCAIVHSSAFLFRKNLEDTFDKREYLKDKTFFKNVNICTIDQVLTQGFNLGFWEIKTFHLLQAKVIIDEVHLYEPYTLGLLIATITYLKREFGTAFYIMTATMPRKLKELLQNALHISDDQLVEDTQLLHKDRNTFEVRDKLVDDLNDEILDELNRKKKVLLVVNTVDEAIRLYWKYKGKAKNIICFHSRFVVKDRLEKEKYILELEKQDEPVLLIATQVVEVSLDIDFDILFTENAPVDAIIQRAGRVNRKREKNNTKVIVFLHQQKTEEFIYNHEDFLLRTFDTLKAEDGKRLTEARLIELVDDVYKNYDVTQDESYKTGLNAYARIQKDTLHFIKDNLGLEDTYTREGLDSENVIPMPFQEQLSKTDQITKSLHEVSISKKRLHTSRTEKDKKHPWYLYFDCDYDFETGLKFKKKVHTIETMIL